MEAMKRFVSNESHRKEIVAGNFSEYLTNRMQSSLSVVERDADISVTDDRVSRIDAETRKPRRRFLDPLQRLEVTVAVFPASWANR